MYVSKKKFIFGSLFFLANKLQVIIDQGLATHEITAKQWFLMAVLGEFYDSPPTLSELAEAMGSSHQNVKQIALKLQQKGFLEMNKDEQDRRAIRLKLTKKCYVFWQQRQEEDKQFLSALFEGISADEINLTFSGLTKLTNNLAKIERVGI